MKRSDIPSLDDLRAFEATARLKTVRLAADELALTHGAVSRRITKLSEDLGFPLFEKKGRGLTLTSEGHIIHLTVARFFKELESSIHTIKAKQEDADHLVLSCEPSVAMRWLMPRIAQFKKDNPSISLNLSVGGGALDFKRENVDLAIRRLDFALPDDWEVIRLFPEEVGPVMIPDMQASFQDGSYTGLGTRTRPHAWTHWLSHNQSGILPSEINYHDQHFLMLEAALVGLGVALSPKVLALDDVERGRLVAPVGFHPDGSDYGIIWPEQKPPSQQAKILIHWLKDACAKSFGP